MSEEKLTQVLARKSATLEYEDLPPEAHELARQCILDYFGVAVAGAGDELVEVLLDELSEAGGAPQASVIGHQTRLPALSAALVNGAAGHALDYDDVNMAMPGHPSVAILPGLLALAELRRSSGREVITAFVAGYETACRVGAALQPGHYNLGFHSTGTVGAFGAAAACARLLGLDAEATALALGIAGTQAAGPQIAVRDDVQAVPRRQGGAERAPRGSPRRARIFKPRRHYRMRPGVRVDARPGFLARSCPRHTRGRAAPLRQPLQIPCRVLSDACADRMRPPAARAASGDPRG